MNRRNSIFGPECSVRLTFFHEANAENCAKVWFDPFYDAVDFVNGARGILQDSGLTVKGVSPTQFYPSDENPFGP